MNLGHQVSDGKQLKARAINYLQQSAIANNVDAEVPLLQSYKTTKLQNYKKLQFTRGAATLQNYKITTGAAKLQSPLSYQVTKLQFTS